MSIQRTAIATVSLTFLLFNTAISTACAFEPKPSTRFSIEISQLVQQGRELYEAGQFAQAVQVWQQAAKTYQAQKDLLNQAMVLSNLSLAYQQLGQWNQAEVAIAKSLEILGYPAIESRGDLGIKGTRRQGRQLPITNYQSKIQSPLSPKGTPIPPFLRGELKSKIQNAAVLGQALNTQASLQLALGQAQQALDTWQTAAEVYERAGDRTGKIRSLLNQAQALQALGLYRRALATLESVNQSLQRQPESLLKVASLRSLGNALRVVGDLGQSQQVLQQSLTLAQKLRSPADIGAALFSLGNTARSQQNNAAALTLYQQAAIASRSPSGKLQAQLNQLSLLIETEQFSSARSLLPEIQSHFANLPPSSQAVYARIDFAQSLLEVKSQCTDVKFRACTEVGSQNPANLKDIAQLLATAVKQAQNLGDQRAEAYALGNLGSVYERDRQWSSAKQLTEQALLLAQSVNAPDIAYRWQWQLGRLLKVTGDTPGAIASYTEAVKTLKSLRSDLVAVNPEIQFDFRDEVEPVYRELVALLLQPPSASQVQPGKQGISQQNLIQARATIESLQLAELDNFFREACLEAQPVLIDKVVERDRPTAAVIYPIILRDRLEVILKIPKQPLRHYTIPVSQSQVEQTLEQLRQKIVEPDTIKTVKSLSQQVYSWLIQPAAEQLQQSGVKTLIFVPDGALRNIPMAALYDGKQYLIEKYAIALSPGLQLVNPQPMPSGQLKALTAGLSIPPANFPYPPLPAVKAEIASIEQAGVSTSELLDRQFTSKSLATEIDTSSFNVVHLATHGQFSSQAKNTFILAADGPINVKQFDELLRTRNQRQPEAIQLLVLSACETATGDKRAALGLAGVAVRAGASSTLASLWQIDDRATAALIGEFYKELAKAKVDRAEAIRRAQLTLLKNYSNYRRPGYWAPFVLIGNWL